MSLPSLRAAGLALLLVPALAAADTIRVPADQPTIQAGIDAAINGDIVLVAPATYTGAGNRNLDFGGKAITLRSESGPELTIIDCESQGRGLWFHIGETAAAVVEGFTITRGLADTGGGLLATGAATSPTILRCVFTTNVAFDIGGGALFIAGGAPQFTECVFAANDASHGAGGAAYCESATPAFNGCRFTGNHATFMGGAISATQSNPTFLDCIFAGNSTLAYGGAILGVGSAPMLDHCTLYGNSALFNGGGGGLSLDEASTATISNTIIAFSTDGEAVNCRDGSSATLSCCDAFGNADGDWTSCLAGQQGQNGNLAADPLFCDAPGGDFTLNAASPCQPANSPGNCGLIGALPVACGTVAVPDPAAEPLTPSTWGAIKATRAR